MRLCCRPNTGVRQHHHAGQHLTSQHPGRTHHRLCRHRRRARHNRPCRTQHRARRHRSLRPWRHRKARRQSRTRPWRHRQARRHSRTSRSPWRHRIARHHSLSRSPRRHRIARHHTRTTRVPRPCRHRRARRAMIHHKRRLGYHKRLAIMQLSSSIAHLENLIAGLLHQQR